MTDDRVLHDDADPPFLYVPHGQPEPTDWMKRHPGYLRIPATFVPSGTEITPQIRRQLVGDWRLAPNGRRTISFRCAS